MSHFLWGCEHLETEQKALDETLAAFVQAAGGIPLTVGNAVTRQWNDLSMEARLGLLMGNHIPDINTLSNDYGVIQNWLTCFLEAADAPLMKLWKKRAQLVVKHFPACRISDTDPVAVIRHTSQD